VRTRREAIEQRYGEIDEPAQVGLLVGSLEPVQNTHQRNQPRSREVCAVKPGLVLVQPRNPPEDCFGLPDDLAPGQLPPGRGVERRGLRPALLLGNR
jgi:hypothetical protein